MPAEPRSLGPDCAVLTSLGTLYLYRLTQNDLRAFREMPATKLSQDKFRVLLTRIASTHVSEKGILDAGSLTADQVETLDDEQIERIAEAYLDGTTLRWYRHEGASATVSVVRNATEPATKFLDRLIHWYAVRGPGRTAERDTLSASGTYPRPRLAPPDTIVLTRREAWFALGALGLLGVLGIGAFLQHYLLVHSLQKQQDAIIAQVKEANASLAANAARATKENAELRQRLDVLESKLHANSQAPAKAHEPKARPATAASRAAPSKSRTRR
jgi:hypothetical protein